MQESIIKRSGRELRDFFSCLFFPALAAILPWRLCYRVYRYLSRYNWIFREDVEAMAEGIRLVKPDRNTDSWPRHFRLATLVEYADLFIILFRARGHLEKHFDTSSVEFPREKPFFLMFFNFGFGFMVLEYLRREGLHPSLVYRSQPESKPEGMTWMRYLVMKLRVHGMQKVCEHRAIGTGGAYQKIMTALDEKRTVVVVSDAPASEDNQVIDVPLFGHQGKWRAGILKLVSQQQHPAVAFRVTIDWRNGDRQLKITPPLPVDNEIALAKALVDEFHLGIDEHPELWLYWTAIEVFLPGINDKPT